MNESRAVTIGIGTQLPVGAGPSMQSIALTAAKQALTQALREKGRIGIGSLVVLWRTCWGGDGCPDEEHRHLWVSTESEKVEGDHD